MTFSTPWLGRKRVAFVPLFRPNAAPPDQIPPDWENAILRRVLYDPRREANGADRSLRARGCAPSRRAWPTLTPWCCPCRPSTNRSSRPMNSKARSAGSCATRDARRHPDHARRKGAGTNSGFWSRAVMAESNGVWLMELIHGLTGFKDLYSFANDADPPERSIDVFDEMSASSQTHPTAFTKNELGWLDAAAIARHAAHR